MTKTKEQLQKHESPIRQKFYDIIFEAETPSGKLLDVLLLRAIAAMATVGCGDTALRTVVGPCTIRRTI